MSNKLPSFASPVTWDSQTNYEALTIVVNDGHAYTSKQDVPSGTSLSNTDYWYPTGNVYKLLGDVDTKVNNLKVLRETADLSVTLYTDTSYTDVTYNFTGTYQSAPFVTVDVFTGTGTQANVPNAVITSVTATSVTVRVWKQYGVANTSSHTPMATPSLRLGVFA